ncbi:MAG TPA: serine/threonine protein kinase [Polyangiaceae bacterium]|nr:serine/threonine protein kinase [Polyangiaceae bacterium]
MTLAQSRYELLTKLAAGGMGTVYVGRLRGAAGFRRLVAIKRAHPHLLEQPSFSRMLIKEAELASAIHHPNAVAVQDVEELDGELLLIMDYVDGVPLSRLLAACDPKEDDPVPPRVAVRIIADICAGLHACHTCTDEMGEPLGLVHRDVSPQNVLVGADGQARLTDFGIAKSLVRDDKLTQTGTIRGKSGYMAPEYATDGRLDQRSDVFAVGVVLWETLAGRRLFRGSTELETLRHLTEKDAPLVSSAAPWVGTALDDVIATALRRDPERRFRSAEALGRALEEAARGEGLMGRHREVAEEVDGRFGTELAERRAAIHTRASVAPGPQEATGTITAAMDDVDEPDPLLDDEMGRGPSTLEASTLVPAGSSTRPAAARRRFVGWIAALAMVAVGVAAATALLDGAPSPLAAQPALPQLDVVVEPGDTESEPMAPSAPASSTEAGTTEDVDPTTGEPTPPPVATAPSPPPPPAVLPPPAKTPPPRPPAPTPPEPSGLEAKSNPYTTTPGAKDNPFKP